ncbi:MAG: hypothetical protein RJP95_02355 [Pirellulales bacterium]
MFVALHGVFLISVSSLLVLRVRHTAQAVARMGQEVEPLGSQLKDIEVRIDSLAEKVQEFAPQLDVGALHRLGAFPETLWKRFNTELSTAHVVQLLEFCELSERAQAVNVRIELAEAELENRKDDEKFGLRHGLAMTFSMLAVASNIYFLLFAPKDESSQGDDFSFIAISFVASAFVCAAYGLVAKRNPDDVTFAADLGRATTLAKEMTSAYKNAPR